MNATWSESEVEIDHHTGDHILYSLRTVCGFFIVPENFMSASLAEKTRKSNRLQMSWQRRHSLLSYFKTLSVGLAEVAPAAFRSVDVR